MVDINLLSEWQTSDRNEDTALDTVLVEPVDSLGDEPPLKATRPVRKVKPDEMKEFQRDYGLSRYLIVGFFLVLVGAAIWYIWPAFFPPQQSAEVDLGPGISETADTGGATSSGGRSASTEGKSTLPDVPPTPGTLLGGQSAVTSVVMTSQIVDIATASTQLLHYSYSSGRFSLQCLVNSPAHANKLLDELNRAIGSGKVDKTSDERSGSKRRVLFTGSVEDEGGPQGSGTGVTRSSFPNLIESRAKELGVTVGSLTFASDGRESGKYPAKIHASGDGEALLGLIKSIPELAPNVEISKILLNQAVGRRSANELTLMLYLDFYPVP